MIYLGSFIRAPFASATLVLFLSTQAIASDARNRTEYCSKWADFAANQMKHRQDGLPIRKVMDALLKSAIVTSEMEGAESDFRIALGITEMAYNQDLAPTYRGAEIAVIEFRENNLYACLDSGKTSEGLK